MMMPFYDLPKTRTADYNEANTPVSVMKKEELINHIAAHILRHGLGDTSLRIIANAIGTSDRMLLYYFADKNEMISAAIDRIAGNLATILDSAGPAKEKQSFEALFTQLWTAIQSPIVIPYIKVWIELSALSQRNTEPEARAAKGMTELFLNWTQERLQTRRGENPREKAACLIAMIDGLVLLLAVGKSEEAKLAALAMAKLKI